MVLLSKVQVVALHGSDDRQSVSEVLRRVERVVTGMAEYIDKAVVDKTLCDYIRELNRAGAGIESSAVFEALARFRYLPAADVRENVKGEWIQHYETTSDNETLPYGWECSLCGRWEMEKQPFCNCGAQMMGGAEDG